MNKNFHWYAVKTILSDPDLFGTTEDADRYSDEAYKIAYFSQFTDDYNIYVPFSVCDSDIPPEGNSLRDGNNNINPVTTGFNTWPPDLFLSASDFRSYHRKTVIPFHFIPDYGLNSITAMRNETREMDVTTYSVKHLDLTSENYDRTLLGNMMKKAREAYIKSKPKTPQRDKAAVLIGVLLHIFADTYAHEHFNGFNSNWNYVDVKAVRHFIGDTDNTDNRNTMAKTASSVKTYFYETILPKTGHAMAKCEPDYNNGLMTYYFTMRNANAAVIIPRNNYSTSLECAYQIYNFLRECRGLPWVERDSAEWDRLSSELSFGFLMDFQTKECDQKSRWKQIARLADVNLDYDMGFLFGKMTDDKGNPDPGLSWRQFFTITVSGFGDILKFPIKMNNPDFWYFNIFAKMIRNAVNETQSTLPTLEAYLAS
jgi:hypothetical protein